jgi:hypothetical protein
MMLLALFPLHFASTNSVQYLFGGNPPRGLVETIVPLPRPYLGLRHDCALEFCRDQYRYRLRLPDDDEAIHRKILSESVPSCWGLPTTRRRGTPKNDRRGLVQNEGSL